MEIGSILPYFLIMAALAGFCELIVRIWPFYTKLATPNLAENHIPFPDGHLSWIHMILDIVLIILLAVVVISHISLHSFPSSVR